MEENNNDEKTILDKGKEAVKKESEKFAKKEKPLSRQIALP